MHETLNWIATTTKLINFLQNDFNGVYKCRKICSEFIIYPADIALKFLKVEIFKSFVAFVNLRCLELKLLKYKEINEKNV